MLKLLLSLCQIILFNPADAAVRGSAVSKKHVYVCPPGIQHPLAGDTHTFRVDSHWDPLSRVFQCRYGLFPERHYEPPQASVHIPDEKLAAGCRHDAEKHTLTCEEGV